MVVKVVISKRTDNGSLDWEPENQETAILQNTMDLLEQMNRGLYMFDQVGAKNETESAILEGQWLVRITTYGLNVSSSSAP